MTLQRKLIWTGLLIVLLPMLLSTGVMWGLIQRQNNHDAIERSEQLLGVIRHELDHQAEDLLAEMLQFSKDTTLLNNITFLNQGGNIAKDIGEFYKIELGGASAKFASMNAYNMVMLFDKEHALVSYVQIEGSKYILGLVSQTPDDSVTIKTITSERVIMGKEDAKPNDWMLSTPSEGIPLHYAESGPESLSSMMVFQGRLVIKTEVAIRSIPENPDSPLLGRLVGYCYLDQSFAERLAELTLTHVNIFLESRLSVGTLAEFSTIPEFYLTELERLPATGEKLSWHTEHVINDHPYYQLYYPFVRRESGAIQGTLALSVSKEPTYRKTREVVFLLSGVSLVCVILIIPITVFLSGKIARPIREMAAISESIAEGAIEQDIEPNSSHDEIGKFISLIPCDGSLFTQHGDNGKGYFPWRNRAGDNPQIGTRYVGESLSAYDSLYEGDLGNCNEYC